MSDRVEYIRRRLDQLEAAAKAATPGPWRISGTGTYVDVVDAMDRCVAVDAEVGAALPRDAEHIALWDPAAVLARVAADRKLLAEHKAWDFNEDGYEVCGRCMEHRRRGKGWKFMAAPCPTIRLMAEGLGWKEGSSE